MPFKSLFWPEAAVCGLDIESSAVRLVWLENGRLKKESAPLPPGTIRGGRLENKNQFSETLRKLKSESGFSGKIPVLLSFPPESVAVKNFNLPNLRESELPAAAALNLQLNSPAEARSAYYDWQKSGQEFLAAFIRREIADEYIAALEGVGFAVLAAEFPALALARLIKEESAALDLSKPQIVLSVSGDGLEFLALKSGELVFSRFYPVAIIEKFSEVLLKGLGRTLEFSSGSGLVLAAAGLRKEIEQIIKTKYPDLKIRLLALRRFSGLAPVWYAGLGSALRSRFLRTDKKIISLAPAASGDQLGCFEVLSFARAWQRAFLKILNLTAAIFLVLAVGLSFWFYYLQSRILTASQSPAALEAAAIGRQAEQFNNLLAKVLSAKDQSNDLPAILSEINSAAKSAGVTLVNVAFDGESGKVSISGKAASESEVLDFKNKLAAKESVIKNVILPLSGVVSNKDKTVSFGLTFNI